MINIFYYLIIFFIGLCIGSFLNCVIWRLFTKENFLISRSYCPKCRQILSWQDLIPVLSFIILKGKCRYCREKISYQYPLLEIATGLLFVLIFYFQTCFFNEFCFQNIVNLLYLWIISCFLIIIFTYDLKHFIIPNQVIYPAIVIAFFYQLFNLWNFKPLLFPVFSAVFASAFFFSIVLISQGKWMGMGDVKLAFLMGLLLGFPQILLALFLAFLIGAIIGLSLIMLKKKTLKSEVPFGPFLIIGTFIAMFWGEKIINLYLKYVFI